MKYRFHGAIRIFDLEEYFKLDYINYAKTSFFFWPGNHDPRDFFGHPGFNNYLYYLFAKIFGASLASARAFCLLMSALCVGSLYFLVRELASARVAFFTSISFLILPMFNVQSIMFLNELGSFFFVFSSLYFYVRKQYLLYALLGVGAVLYLESAVAYYLSLGFYAIYISLKEHKDAIQWKPLLSSLLPLFSLMLFFIVERWQTGSFSNHVTSSMIQGRLSDPVSWLQNFYYREILFRRYLTFKENGALVFLLAVFILAIFHWFKRREWTMGNGLPLLFYPLILQLLFYSFLSIYEGGRDFYSGFVFLFFYFYYNIFRFRRGLVVATVIFASLGGFSYLQLQSGQGSHFQTTFKEYEYRKGFIELSEIIYDIDGLKNCHITESISSLFCTSFFGYKEKEISTFAKDKNNKFFMIVRRHAQEMWISNFVNNEFKLLSNIHLKRLRSGEYRLLTFMREIVSN